MIKKQLKHDLCRNEKGFTFIEILISIVLLVFIIGAFLNVFVVSNKINNSTLKSVDYGMMAQTHMEDIYLLSKGRTMAQFLDELVNNQGYSLSDSGGISSFTKAIGNSYLKVVVEENAYPSVNARLFKLEIEIYKDASYSDLAASLQNVLSFQ